NFHVHRPAVPGHGARHRADSPGHFPLPADHFAHVFRCHVDFVNGGAVTFYLGDAHFVGALHQRLGNIFEKVLHPSACPPCSAALAAAPREACHFSRTPACCSRRRTVSEGCAPRLSHIRAFSSSTTTSAGSATGL